jgi:hypothetical protein
MRVRVRWVLVALVGVLGASACGCGSEKPKLAKVRGTVTIDGRPLPRGTIVFESKGQRAATGNVVDGEIVEVTTFKPGDGCPVGDHKVAVRATQEAASAEVSHPGEAKALPANYMGGRSLIPPTYSASDTSGLTATVTGGDNALRFELTSAPAKSAR